MRSRARNEKRQHNPKAIQKALEFSEEEPYQTSKSENASRATAVGADESDAWLACKLKSVHGDLEDNLVIAAAQRAHATYLVTNDEALIKHAPVAALTPEDALTMLQAIQ